MIVTMSLSKAFEDTIKEHARAYVKAVDECTRREWLFGQTSNDEWDENGEKHYKSIGINNKDFNALTSKAINEVAGFALITETGDTLKMWREVAAQFENVPEGLKKLPFDYFRKARTLWNMSERGETIKHISLPIAPIAEAAANCWTAREMYEVYTDPVVMVQHIQARDQWTPEKRQAFAVAFDEFMKGWL